jgi:hypothetical protein
MNRNRFGALVSFGLMASGCASYGVAKMGSYNQLDVYCEYAVSRAGVGIGSVYVYADPATKARVEVWAIKSPESGVALANFTVQRLDCGGSSKYADFLSRMMNKDVKLTVTAPSYPQGPIPATDLALNVSEGAVAVEGWHLYCGASVESAVFRCDVAGAPVSELAVRRESPSAVACPTSAETKQKLLFNVPSAAFWAKCPASSTAWLEFRRTYSENSATGPYTAVVNFGLKRP